MKVIKYRKVIKWGKLSSDESYLLVKVIKWWKSSCDGTLLVMKVKEVEIEKWYVWWGVMAGDVSPVAMFNQLNQVTINQKKNLYILA